MLETCIRLKPEVMFLAYDNWQRCVLVEFTQRPLGARNELCVQSYRDGEATEALVSVALCAIVVMYFA